MSIISLSGRMNVGKDTVGKIWQIIDGSPHFTTKGVMQFLNKPYDSRFEIKKWADSLKDMVCILLGCTREELEDRDFKEKELGEEWWYYKIYIGNGKYELTDYLNNDKLEDWIKVANPRYLIKPTPRLLLQLLGTECMRNIIHPNAWVNSLMSKYNKKWNGKTFFAHGVGREVNQDEYPFWLITDTRFPNELEAVKKKNGITIRVDRHIYKSTIEKIKPYSDLLNHGIPIPIEHESETALDNATFDYYINNNGSLEELIEEVIKIYQDVKKNKLL